MHLVFATLLTFGGFIECKRISDRVMVWRCLRSIDSDNRLLINEFSTTGQATVSRIRGSLRRQHCWCMIFTAQIRILELILGVATSYRIDVSYPIRVFDFSYLPHSLKISIWLLCLFIYIDWSTFDFLIFFILMSIHHNTGVLFLQEWAFDFKSWLLLNFSLTNHCQGSDYLI